MIIQRIALASCLALTLTFAATAADSIDTKDSMLAPHESWDCMMPGGIYPPSTGTLVCEIEMNIRDIYDIGQTQFGQRKAYVIKDGTVTGEKFKGEVLAGGLDYELTLSNGVIEVEQILVFRTSEGTPIYSRSPGVGLNADDVRVAMDFEAPNNSAAAWLQEGSYVASRKVDEEAKTITLAVYDVSEVKVADIMVTQVTKPEDMPSQPWDFRKAEADESQGDQFITENVALGGSVSVGQTKNGSRNIIPITGGTLTGDIKGEVLFGGADYQNFGGAAAIDARYLWKTDDGEVIVVRNAGPFNSLVPIFEAKVDGEYAWLNTGKFLSSGPGMGSNGVSLSFYKSK